MVAGDPPARAADRDPFSTMPYPSSKPPPFLPLLLLAGLWCMAPSSHRLQAAGWPEVFDPFTVLTLHLDMQEGDWSTVRNDDSLSIEVPARLREEGETNWLDVVVRRKSGPALTNGGIRKVALKVDVNDAVPGQEWRGLRKLSLESGAELSVLKEGFGWQLFRLASEWGVLDYHMGHAAWVRVVVNGEYQGVYANVEQRDRQFLRNRGMEKEAATWLYKVDGGTSLEVGLGDSPTHEYLCYSPFSEGPGGGGNPDCPQPDLEADIPAWVDLRGLLGVAAITAFSANGDALATHDNKNSYAADFLPPDRLRRLYFPWDLDTGFSTAAFDIYEGPRQTTAYQTHLLGHYWFRDVYRHLMAELLEGPLSTESLTTFLDDLEPVLAPALAEDPNAEQDFDDLRQWIAARVANVRTQIGPLVSKPRFSILPGRVTPGMPVGLSHTNGSGLVYYTLDGSDPRGLGGAAAGPALQGDIGIQGNTIIRARVMSGTEWSDLAEGVFTVAGHTDGLRVTEIMYRPAEFPGGLDGGEYEFLELKNTGAHPINLSGAMFEGLGYRMSPGTVLMPGAFHVLVHNAVAFEQRYPGVTYDGIYWGGLDKDGETFRLVDAHGAVLLSVDYDNDPPWPQGPNGLGYSLVRQVPDGNPDRPESWRGSTRLHGSPGADDPLPPYGLGMVINEVLTHTDAPFEDAIELHNTGEEPVDISGWFLSDSLVRTNLAGSLRKFRIPDGTVVPAGGWVAFYEADFNPQPGLPPSFALAQSGETIYLSSADAMGELTGSITAMEVGAADNGVAYGRHATSVGIDETWLEVPTFGVVNPPTKEAFREGTGAVNAPPRVGPVVIGEIHYHPAEGGVEFVELHNLTSSAIDLADWELEGVDYVFPAGAAIAAGGLLLMADTNAMSVAAFRAAHGVNAGVPVWGHSFRLENNGESLRLLKVNDDPLGRRILVDRVRYGDHPPWPVEADGQGPSLERHPVGAYGNEPLHWRLGPVGGSPGRLDQLRITQVWRQPGGGLGFRWEAVAGRRYQIEFTGTLDDWMALGTPVEAASDQGEFVDEETGPGRRYYRVRLLD